MLLRAIYDWFTEGFDTVPLIEAQELLESADPEALAAALERLKGGKS